MDFFSQLRCFKFNLCCSNHRSRRRLFDRRSYNVHTLSVVRPDVRADGDSGPHTRACCRACTVDDVATLSQNPSYFADLTSGVPPCSESFEAVGLGQ